MLTVHITDDTKPALLRAIRAACNELLGETVEQSLPTAAAESLQAFAEQEQEALASAFDKAVETAGAPAVAAAMLAEQAEELDSAGQPWNAELHASTKSKNADGTWKKRRGSAQQQVGTDSKREVEEMLAEEHSAPLALPPLPPAPTAPAAPLVTMTDIYALITNNKCVLNDVIAAAQAMGFADVGAFSRDATPEQRAQLLQELTA